MQPLIGLVVHIFFIDIDEISQRLDAVEGEYITC